MGAKGAWKDCKGRDDSLSVPPRLSFSTKKGFLEAKEGLKALEKPCVLSRSVSTLRNSLFKEEP